jgi:probable HAF family extracellular repeat protein
VLLWDGVSLQNIGHAGAWTEPTGINASGAISGFNYDFANDKNNILRWDGASWITVPGLGGSAYEAALGINDPGQLTGTGYTASNALHAFLWDPSLGMQEIAGYNGDFAQGYGITNAGMVVGEAVTPSSNGETFAYAWTAAGGMVDLGSLGGLRSEARDVNNLGQVTGSAMIADNAYHAFVWTAGGGMVDLGTLTQNPACSGPFGCIQPWSQAGAINDSGQVVGRAMKDGGVAVGFVWDPQGGMRAIEVGPATEVKGINSSGVIVGYFDWPPKGFVAEPL